MSKRKKLSAADRPQFRRDLRDLHEKLDMKVREIDSDAIIVCSKADEWDPATNVLWELEANRSAVRNDVHCFCCRAVMVMSNDAYAKYQALDKKPKVSCLQCMVKFVESQK